MSFPPEVAVARLVNSLKGISNRWMRTESSGLARHHHRAKNSGPATASLEQSAEHRSMKRDVVSGPSTHLLARVGLSLWLFPRQSNCVRVWTSDIGSFGLLSA